MEPWYPGTHFTDQAIRAHLVGDTEVRRMFSCGCKQCRTSGSQESQGGPPALLWIHWVRLHLRCQSLWRLSQRSSRVTGENDQNTEEPFRVQSLESSRQDQLRNELLPDICGRNLHFRSNMGLISWDFIPTQQVLDLLFPSASPSFPGTWVNFYTEASHQPPGSLSLQLLLQSMWLLLGGLNLEHEAHHLLAQTEDGKSSQAEPESQADWATSSVPVTAPKPTPEPEPSPWEGAEPESRTSGVSTRSSSRPQYNKRVGGSCLIHVYLENERTTKYKSILVTCQDRVPVIIRRALDAHLLQQEDPENFELLQIVSNHQKLRIPADGNVYHALDGRVDYNFLLRETAASKWSKVKPKEVTCHDRAPVVIRRALELHLLTQEKPEEYELGQIISHRQKLRIPAQANVFYAKNPHTEPNFVLRKRSLSQKNDEWIQPQPPSRPAKKAPALLRMLAKPFYCCVPGRG
ncbi:ral guanine nucleotide dissociation stimulator isoform X8 [Marmota monax]|uniref:ral guanine nucleotide dissociation stimulator isoform X8 n=1 Tax=Marmota monax TaxID=9995 RepID=UPI001EAFE6E8|nr:ral guanine nucleotide dissociation stimulator isoform X8 [Marmota monax]XP_046318801.1 ral guanine nucleotide dissociation stimulator isoform X8 [Marmota monax]